MAALGEVQTSEIVTRPLRRRASRSSRKIAANTAIADNLAARMVDLKRIPIPIGYARGHLNPLYTPAALMNLPRFNLQVRPLFDPVDAAVAIQMMRSETSSILKSCVAEMTVTSRSRFICRKSSMIALPVFKSGSP